MARTLIVFASIDGQTRRIADRIARHLREAGHAVTLLPAAEAPPQLAGWDATLVGGAIRYGHFPRALERWVRMHRDALTAAPNAFFSVSLSAGGPGAKPEAAQGYLEEFRARTGWQPRAVASFAGALPYRQYNPFIRFMMRMIVRAAGGETDTSRDYEYTDWQAVDHFAAQFAARLATAPLPA